MLLVLEYLTGAKADGTRTRMPRREFTALEINLKRVYRLFSADLTAYSNVFLRCFVFDS